MNCESVIRTQYLAFARSAGKRKVCEILCKVVPNKAEPQIQESHGLDRMIAMVLPDQPRTEEPQLFEWARKIGSWLSLMRDESVSPYAKEGFGSGYASEGASRLIVQFIAQRKQEPSSKNADCRTVRREFASGELIHSVSPEVFPMECCFRTGPPPVLIKCSLEQFRGTMKTALISLVAASGLAIAQFNDIDRQRELEKQQRQIRDLEEQQDRMKRDQQTKEIMDNAAKRQRVAALRSEEHMHPPTLENFKLQALDQSYALVEKLQKERDIAVKENQSIVNDFNALVEDYKQTSRRCQSN
jgi:type II secretory pathway pseudopilin PulG